MDLKIPNITPIEDIIDKRTDLKELKELSKNKPKKKNGGKRPGAGFPKGKKTKKVIEREAAEKAFKEKIMNSIDKLFVSQFSIANGCQYLFKIETKRWKTKAGKWKEEKKPPKIVKDPYEIEAYLRGDYDGGKDEFYFLTTDKPDNKAIDSLVERVFGKAKQSMDLNAAITLEDALRKNLEERQKNDKNTK